VAKLAARVKRTKEMNHVVTETSPGELGVGCSCGKRFPTRKAAELHATDQNLIEQNEAKAKKAEGHWTSPPGQKSLRIQSRNAPEPERATEPPGCG
jgi:hypothetical protein